MRILILSPKILDESLSSTSRDASMEYLSHHAEIVLIGRFRDPSSASTGRKYEVVPVGAPRVPIVNMLWFMIRGTAAVASALKRSTPDVILVEPASVVPAIAGRLCARLRTAPPIHLDVRTMPVPGGGWRSLLERAFTALTLRLACRGCSGFSAITDGVAGWMSQSMGLDPAEITIWSTGVDPVLFDPARFPSRDSTDSGTLRVIYHGAVSLSRGLGELVIAMSRISTDGHRARLTILGNGPDVDAVTTLRDKSGLRDVVTISPAVALADVPAVIAGHDIGIIPLPDLPCWSTSSPTKLMEYLAMGIPVIATEIEAHRAVLNSDGPVVWAGTGDAVQLAEAIKTAGDSLGKLTSRARAGRDDFVAAYSWNAQAALLLSALQRTSGTI